jgi:hypothetical protein
MNCWPCLTAFSPDRYHRAIRAKHPSKPSGLMLKYRQYLNKVQDRAKGSPKMGCPLWFARYEKADPSRLCFHVLCGGLNPISASADR